MYPLRNEHLIITLTLSLLILLISGSLNYADSVPLSFEGHWAADTLKRWMNDGLIDFDFDPDEPISRAELIDLINRLTGDEALPILPQDAPITRQDTSQLILTLLDSDALSDPTLLDFYSDSGHIASDRRDAISHLIRMNILQGYPDQTLRPRSLITHSEALSLLDRTFTRRLVKAGTYQLYQEREGATSISSSNIIVYDSFFRGSLFLTGNLMKGPIVLENITSRGKTTISSSGVYPVMLDGDFDNLIISSSSPTTAPIVLSGSYEKIEIHRPVEMTIEPDVQIKELTLSPQAVHSYILLQENSHIESVSIQSPIFLEGSGTIGDAHIDSINVSCEPSIISLSLPKDLTTRMEGNLLTVIKRPPAIHRSSRDTKGPKVSSLSIDGTHVTEDSPIHFTSNDTYDQIAITMNEKIQWADEPSADFTLVEDSLILQAANTPYAEGDMIIQLPAGMIMDSSGNENLQSQIHLSFVNDYSPPDYAIVLAADSNKLYTDYPIDLDISISPSELEVTDYEHARLEIALTECPIGAHAHLLEDEWTDLLQVGYWPALDGFPLGGSEDILIPGSFMTDQPGIYQLQVKLIDLDQGGTTIALANFTLEIEDLMAYIGDHTILSYPQSLSTFEEMPLESTLSIDYPDIIASAPGTWQVDTLISFSEDQSFPDSSSITLGEATYYIEGSGTHQLYASQITGIRALLRDALDNESSMAFSDLPTGTYDLALQQVASEDCFETMTILNETTCSIEVVPQLTSTYKMDSDIPSHYFTIDSQEDFELYLQIDQMGSTGYEETFFLFDSLSQPEGSIYHLVTEDLNDLTVMPAIGLSSPFVIAPNEQMTLPLTFTGDREGIYVFRISLMDSATFNHTITSGIFSITVNPVQ